MVATMLPKNKKNRNAKGNRLLITISVIGSLGPIRFIVNEEDLVAAVIDTALKSYAREGRLPILGSNLGDFLLYCSNGDGESDALNPWDKIGSQGIRNFLLFQKPREVKVNEDGKFMEAMKKVNCRWKSWFHKSLNLKISTHCPLTHDLQYKCFPCRLQTTVVIESTWL